MKTLTAILIFLTGLGSIAYSYVGSVVTLANDAEKVANEGNDAGAFMMIVEFILRGEMPRQTGFLYLGLLLIAVSVVTLIVRRSNNDE